MVRQQLEEPVRKIATRNMYFDPAGKHVRTKKEATNENGLLPGYTILSEEKMKKDVLCLLQK